MINKYDIAMASVLGSDHAKFGKNNQDAALVVSDESFLLGVVSDGCGSCPRSEVGAVLTTRLVARWLPQTILGSKTSEVERGLNLMRNFVARDIHYMADSLADITAQPAPATESGEFIDGYVSKDGILESCFLATVFGFFACDEFVVLFNAGDGYSSVNGNVRKVEAEGNAPFYPAYDNMPNVEDKFRKIGWGFEVFPAAEVEKVMVATDGIRHIEMSSNLMIPGKSRPVGGLEQLWDDKMFLNTDQMRRTLALLNRDVHMPDWVGQSMVKCPAILRDDTTVISIRRRK